MIKYAGLLVAVAVLAACSTADQGPSGIVVINASVIDGSGGPAVAANVRVVGERIVTVGEFEPTAADEVVDADGLVLVPGFVDTHSHHEDGLLDMPEALALVSQGVTTIVAGMDGGQQYPLADFLHQLDASPASVNVASFAGHGKLRELVLGDDYKREATPAELSEMSRLLKVEMEAGALGLATGLEYDPGSFSSTDELIQLAKISAGEGGRYLSHIRSEDQYFWDALDEAITIGRDAGLPVRISHIKLAMPRWWGQAHRLISRLDEARESGVDITADIYPYRAWNTNLSWLRNVFPDRHLERREGAEYVLEHMLSPEGILLPDYLPEPRYSGLTLAEISEIRGTDPESTLMYLLQADAEVDGESNLLGFAMIEPDIEALMAWPHAVIGSDGELAGPHPRGYGAFARFLGHYVRNREVVSLEEGIRKISSLPAEQVGIAERGMIKVGYFADLVLLDPADVIDRATFESPHVPSAGIKRVWVNGQLVFVDGQATDNRPGRTIRGGQR